MVPALGDIDLAKRPPSCKEPGLRGPPRLAARSEPSNKSKVSEGLRTGESLRASLHVPLLSLRFRFAFLNPSQLRSAAQSFAALSVPLASFSVATWPRSSRSSLVHRRRSSEAFAPLRSGRIAAHVVQTLQRGPDDRLQLRHALLSYFCLKSFKLI